MYIICVSLIYLILFKSGTCKYIIWCFELWAWTSMPVMLISSSLFLRKSGSRWDDWPGGKFLPSLACSTALPRLCLSSLDLRARWNNGSIPLHYLQLGIAATDQFNNLIILQVTVSAFWHRRHDNQCPEVWTINQQGVGVLLLPSSSHHCSSSNWRGRSLRLQWSLPPTTVLQLQCWLMTLATSLYLSTKLYFVPNFSWQPLPLLLHPQ